MNNPETYLLKRNCFIRHLVDVFTDEKKAVIFKTRNNVTDFDEITKVLSIIFLNVFIVKKIEQVCSMLKDTKEKENFFEEKNVFPSVL